MTSRAAELIKTIKSRIGPLAWGTIVVTIFLRMSDAVSFFSKIVVGRWLDAVDFGAIEPVASVLAFVGIPSAVIYQIGVKSISRLLARGDRAGFNGLVRDLARVAMIGSLISIAVIAVAGDLILSRLHLESRVYLLILGGMFVIVWWAPLANAFLQGTQKFHLLAITVVIAPGVVLVLTILLVGLLDQGLPGALAAKVMGPFVACVVFWLVVRKMLGGERSRYREEHGFMKTMLLPMLVFASVHATLLHFDRLFVRNFMLEHSGGYGAVITFGQIPMWLITPASFVLFPLAAGQHAAGKDIAKFYRQAMLFGIAVTAGCVVFFLFSGTAILRFWNVEFAPYGRLVWAYTLAMGLQAILDIVARAEMARHRYSFLWFMGIPTVVMCGVVYFFERSMTLERILMIFVGARVVMVAAVILLAHLGQNKHCSNV